MNTVTWREEAGGKFVAELARFNLIVRQPADSHPAHFLVQVRRSADAGAVVGSGRTLGIAEAMNAAEKIAERAKVSTRGQTLDERVQRRHLDARLRR